MKRFLLLFVSFLSVSCINEAAFKIPEAGDNESIPVSFEDLKINAEEYYGKYVKLVGMCVRVDKRGGSTMYMIGNDPSYEIKVAAGEDVTRFTRYFEGRVMEVLGHVRDEDPVRTLASSKESGDRHKDPCTCSKPNYYIESKQYRRITQRP
jgi:hypothetical protein